MRTALLVTALALFSMGCKSTCEQTREPEAGSATTLVVYDVSDLLCGLNGLPVEEAQREERVRDVIGLIEGTIDPDHWVATGGTVGAISEFHGSLVVRTTEANHAEVKDLFAQIRKQRGPMIHVEARFMAVDQDFLNAVGLAAITTDDPPRGNVIDLSGAYLNDVQVKSLIRAGQGGRRVRTITALRTTLFNHGSVTMSVGPQAAAEMKESGVDAGAIGNAPDLSVHIQGEISRDRKYATLHFRHQFGIAEIANEETSEPGKAISIPDRGTLMLDGGPYTEGDAGDVPRRLLILLKPTIVNRQADPVKERAETGNPVPELGSRPGSRTLLMGRLTANRSQHESAEDGKETLVQPDEERVYDRVHDLLKQAVRARSELKYEEALEYVARAKEIDPDNPIVEALREMIEFDSTQRCIRDKPKSQASPNSE